MLWPVREPFTVRTDTDADFYLLSKSKFEGLVQVLHLAVVASWEALGGPSCCIPPFALCQDFPDVMVMFKTVNRKRLEEWQVDDV